MKILFLFGLVVLPACVYKKDARIYATDTKASEDIIRQKKNEGGFITPSSEVRSLRLLQSVKQQEITQSFSSDTQESKETIRARLSDIPTILSAYSYDACVDASGNAKLIYMTHDAYEKIYEQMYDDLDAVGWNNVQMYHDPFYGIICATKPHKHAVIIVHTTPSTWLSKQITIVTMFIHME